jgi:hypothetical protein
MYFECGLPSNANNAQMQSFITLLLQFPPKAWAALVAAVLPRGGDAVLLLASVLGRPPCPCCRWPKRGGLHQKLRPRKGTGSPGSCRGLTAPSKAPAGDGRTFPARLNRRTQGTQNVQRSEHTVTAAGRDGNHHQRAFSPPVCRRRYAPWRRQLAIYAATRRQDHVRRGR